MAVLVFWIALAFVFYVYLGYPLLVVVLGVVLDRRVQKAPWTPRISVLIAAHNEEAVLDATLRNKLEQNYPVDLLEILVVSDGSSDRTDEIVAGFADPRVHLLRQEPRAGKTSALNLAVTQASGEILVFSDANSLYAPDALRQLANNFSDPEIGYVTGKMIYANPDGSPIGEGCSTYMSYENALRNAETRIGSVVGVDGGIDAVRGELYIPMNSDQLPDFVLPLQVIKQGFRVVYEPQAVLWESTLKEADDEYRMRVRVSLRALWALLDMRQLLSFVKSPLFAWQLWSHKLLRYFCFVFLFTVLWSNSLLLAQGPFYQGVFILQVLGYVGALCMPLLERRGFGLRFLTFARYFSLLNLAAAHAFCKFLLGKKQAIWIPRKG